MRWHRICLAIVLAAVGLSTAELRAQGTKEDYSRSAALSVASLGEVWNSRIAPNWLADGKRFWYRKVFAGGLEFVLVDAEKAVKAPAFDHENLAAALKEHAGIAADARHLPFDRIEIEEAGAVRFEVADKTWRFDPATSELKPTDRLAPAPAPRPRGMRGRFRSFREASSSSPRSEHSPDDRWWVTVRDHNLVLKDRKTEEEFPLTKDGNEADGYENSVFWSPDSKSFVALKTAKGDDRKVYLIESSPKDQLQPKLSSYDYLKPGDRIAITKPHLFNVETRKELPLDETLFTNPWSIDEIRWKADSSRFTFVYNQRGHQVLRVIACDSSTGSTKAIVNETSPTFIDYSNKTYLRIDDDHNEFLWMTEKSGWNHLELIDSNTGEIKNAVTRGEWVVFGIEHIDPEKREITFRAGGIRPGQDPYYVHYAKVNFDGTNLRILTEGDGSHSAEFSPDRSCFVDTYSRVDQPPVHELRSAKDGALILPLETAEVGDLLSSIGRYPERFVAKGRDGKTDIYGVIHRPSNFDPKKKYPVIEAIYAGPQGAFVPKTFEPVPHQQALAELGFIVVQIDGMGTNWRSKAFHDVCSKNLGDAGFPDRILFMKAAAEKEPAMDLSRVGIYGGSAGGQNALGALLFQGDFYKVAVADCGCHDNRMDKIWWNEAWMGWPIGPHYEAQSNVTNAHKLKGKLLLTVGELDHNVDPASTMQVVNALIKAGKHFDLVVFPGADHGAGSSEYGRQRLQDFFVRHLLHVEPPDRNAVEMEGNHP